jgi:hypothetical protein
MAFFIFGFKKVSIYCQILIKLLIYCQNLSNINKSFDLLPKKIFDLLPNLRETFNLLKRSSEIRSSDQLPDVRVLEVLKS